MRVRAGHAGARERSLILFRVPQTHVASGVVPYAAGDRLAVTGWFQTLGA